MGKEIGLEGLLKETGSKRVTPKGGGKEPVKVSHSKESKDSSSYKQWEDNFKRMLKTRRSVNNFRKIKDMVNLVNQGQGNTNK